MPRTRLNRLFPHLGIDVDGLCIADPRHPWGLLNAAMLTTPVLSHDDVLYVGWVATSPDSRRRGLADLVTRRSLEHATRETGITRTALHSTDDGYHVYLKMGYRPVEEFALYGLAEEPVAQPRATSMLPTTTTTSAST